MTMHTRVHDRLRAAATAAALATLAPAGLAGPVASPYPVAGPDDTVAVAAADVSGYVATADSFEDSVEIRDAEGALLRTITRAEIEALAPWFDLGGNQDGPTALAFSDSGRLLFILAFDATTPGDGNPSDVILRYDTFADSLALFERLELSSDENAWPHAAMAHFAARLHVGTPAGDVLTLRAGRNDSSGSVLSTATIPGGNPVTGLGVDRFARHLYAAAGDTILRADNIDSISLSFTSVGSLADPVRALAFSSHYGGPSNPGLYALTRNATDSTLHHIPTDQARGNATFAPSAYTSSTTQWHDAAPTALGTLLLGADEDATEFSDDTDTRLTLDGFIHDEFDQVVTFARGLISPDGEPAGWVIDADVIPSFSRFHPATPDGAGWVVLLLLMDDYINGAPDAQGLVRTILERYAGLAPDGIAPLRSADGIFKHWIDPYTGATKSGWFDEYATLSTMKIVLAADRAAAYYPNDDAIQTAAREIICNVSNWDAYIQPNSDCLYFIGFGGGGPNTSSSGCPFNEGIIFVEQAAVHGTQYSVDAFARWLDRGLWPSAAFVTARPVTTNSFGSFSATFLSMYPFLTQKPYRNDLSWRSHVSNLLESHAAWTDDFGPDYFTVFSAGTTKTEWGGYNADSISYHPGDITTFTSLMALAGDGDANPAISAYHAYRNGARETFKTGASILYRRSDVDPAYTPNSAGLPDVALGALGFADLIAPGAVDVVLAIDYDDQICAPPPPPCPGDIDGDDDTDIFDFSLLASQFGRTVDPGTFGDYDSNGVVDIFDFAVLAADFGCTPE